MSISPFSARPGSPENERRRARLVVVLVTVGIAASLLAYAISPSVRHAVGHAAHSVKGAVGHVLDRDKNEQAKKKTAPATRTRTGTTTQPSTGTTPRTGGTSSP
jgi:hypothetical protein